MKRSIPKKERIQQRIDQTSNQAAAKQSVSGGLQAANSILTEKLNSLNSPDQIGDQRFLVQQRREIATRINQNQGNQYLQRMLEHRPSNLSGVIQRKNGRRTSGAQHVGGDPGNVTFLSLPGGRLGETLAPGEAGYSRQMLSETSAAAEALSGNYEDMLIANVVPNFEGLERQLKVRAKEKQGFQEKAGDWMNTPSTTRRYTEVANWCQNHMNTIENDRRDEDAKLQAYNAWVPRANSFYTSLTRLDAMQDMLGVSDPRAMASALTDGLRQAQEVGQRAQLAHDMGRNTETLDVPAADNTILGMSNETTQAAREMNTAYLGFQQNDLSQRAASIKQEGAQDETRLREINEIKQFVRNVGKTVDVTMAVVSGAPTAIATASTTVARAEASLSAYRNRRQIIAGGRPTHNPTYVTTNEKGEMIVRNVQTGMDRPIQGGEQTQSPDSSFSLPTSVSDLLGGMADFIYASEVREINSRLEQIKSRIAASNYAQEMAATTERIQRFQNALNNFALKCTELQRRMAQRRQSYLEFGIQLDNFARKDQASKQAGQAPGPGEERFATIMTVVAQVRETLTVGQGINQGFDNPGTYRSWAQGIESNRSLSYPRSDVTDFHVPEQEWHALDQVYGQVSRTSYNINQVNDIFSSVEMQARTLISTLHQGGGQPAY